MNLLLRLPADDQSCPTQNHTKYHPSHVSTAAPRNYLLQLSAIPVRRASSAWYQTWQPPQQFSVPMIPKRFLSHTEPPRTRAIDAEGEGRTSVSSCISGLVKAREGTGWWKTQRQQGQQCCSQTARKAALEMLLQWETYNATRNSSVRPISFLSLMRYVAAELDSNKRNTSWFYEDFWHIPMYILINTWETVKVLCTAQRVTWPHSKSSHLWVCNLFCPFQDARQYFNVFIIS